MNFYSSLTELSGKALVLYGFQLLAVAINFESFSRLKVAYAKLQIFQLLEVAINFESFSRCQVVLILKHNRAVAHVFETSVL